MNKTMDCPKSCCYHVRKWDLSKAVLLVVKPVLPQKQKVAKPRKVPGSIMCKQAAEERAEWQRVNLRTVAVGAEVRVGWLCLAFPLAKISALHRSRLHLAKLFSRKSTLEKKKKNNPLKEPKGKETRVDAWISMTPNEWKVGSEHPPGGSWRWEQRTPLHTDDWSVDAACDRDTEKH